MVEVPITIACGNYDRTRAIRDGRVKVEGCAVTYLPLYPEEIFFRAFRYQEFDVSELSFSSYIRTVAAGNSRLCRGFPPSCRGIFRHSGIYIRADAGIRTPADLRGKRIGLPEYQITAVVWMRGMMQHEYGVSAAEIHWRSGGQEEAGRATSAPRSSRSRASTSQPIAEDQTLVGMLRDGELDALFTARAPSSFLRGEPHIARLFPEHARGRAGLFQEDRPVPDHASDRHPQGRWWSNIPGSPTSVYKAFCEAKALAMTDLLRRQRPDGDPALARGRKPARPWRSWGRTSGATASQENMREIEALTQYAHEQGLIDRKVAVEELFHPSMFEISKV